jgi:hypothetical protein
MSVVQAVERVFAYFDVLGTEQSFLISSVQQWAVAEGHAAVLVDLGKFSKREPSEDPMADIPLVNPVQKKDMGSLPVRDFNPVSRPKPANTFLDHFHAVATTEERTEP